MIETWVRVASAASANSTIRLTRSSSANLRRSDSRCAVAGAAAASRPTHSADERHRRAGDDGDRAERRPSGVCRVDGERQGDDAGGVGDRDLRQQREHRRSAEVQRVDDRQDERGRRRCDQHRVERGVPGAERVRDRQRERDRERRRRRARARSPMRSPARSCGSRTGTWVPATNMISPKPMSARNVNVELPGCSTRKPVAAERDPGGQLAEQHRQVPAGRAARAAARAARSARSGQASRSSPGQANRPRASAGASLRRPPRPRPSGRCRSTRRPRAGRSARAGRSRRRSARRRPCPRRTRGRRAAEPSPSSAVSATAAWRSSSQPTSRSPAASSSRVVFCPTL